MLIQNLAKSVLSLLHQYNRKVEIDITESATEQSLIQHENGMCSNKN